MNKKAWALLPFATFFFVLSCSPSTPTPSVTGTLFIRKEPNTTVFNVGQAFDLTGLDVLDLTTNLPATNYTTSIEEGYIFTANDAGKKTVTVDKPNYVSDSFTITVKNYKTMKIQSQPKTEFGLNTNFVTTGLVVVDASTETVLDGWSTSIILGTRLEEEGTFTVTISKTGYLPISYDIHVSDFPYLEIAHSPTYTIYSIGDTFSLAGLVVTVNGQVITDYTVSGFYEDGDEIDQSGDFLYTVSKTDHHSITFAITVYKEKLMHVTSMPTKTEYVTGEAFSSSGLIIKDDNNIEVTGYTLSIADGEKLKNKGNRDIIISKEGYRDVSFSIKVTECTSEYTIDKNLYIYYLNDTHGSFARLEDDNEAGMSYISSYIKSEVAKDASYNNYSLILSGGDTSLIQKNSIFQMDSI